MITLPKHTGEISLVILASGDYPATESPREILARAGKVVCCDGAVAGYFAAGGEPYAIVGDCDSLDEQLREKYAGIVHCDREQETNDLTKAVRFCVGEGLGDIVILGATGKREDHTIANISLMAEYIAMPGVRSVRMITDHAVLDAVCPDGWGDDKEAGRLSGAYKTQAGGFVAEAFADVTTGEPEPEVAGDSRHKVAKAVRQEFVFESLPGQQVSIFTPRHGVEITTWGLRYPLADALLPGWWAGTLNEALADNFSIAATGPAIIYRVQAE